MPRRRDLAEALHAVPLFARCTPRELRTIARFVETADLPPETDLVREGEPGDALFVILEGEAIVKTGDRELARRRGRLLRRARAARRRAARRRRVAATDVKIAVLGIRMFRTLVRELPDLAEQLLAGLATELRAARAVANGR